MTYYLAIFQHSFTEGVAKYPLAVEVLIEPPQIEDTFSMNGKKDSLWEIVEVTRYEPFIRLKKYKIFENIYVCGIKSIELPSGYWDMEFANIDMPKQMQAIEKKKSSTNLKLELPFYKNGIIKENETVIYLDF